MNALMLVWPAAAWVASVSAVAVVGSKMMGWTMTSAMDWVRTSAASLSTAPSGVSPEGTPPKFEIVVMPPASAAAEPDV